MNEQDCIELTKIEQEISDLEYKINNYKPRYSSTIQKEINDLLQKRLDISNQKPYELNKNIIINNVDKLKALKSTGLNFNDENWPDTVKVLVDNNVNLNDPNWKDIIKNLGNKLFESLSSCGLTAFAVQQWVEGIINMITTVISFPINILISFIKQLIDFITALLGIPLNPVDVPDWAKGIITKFKDLISFIVKLPTLPGIIELIMKVIDSILPGFIKFIDAVKLLISNLPKSIQSLKDYINLQSVAMSNLRDLYEKEKKYLITRIAFKKAQLNGGVDVVLQQENEILRGKQRMIISHLEDIKKLAKDNPSLKDELLIQKDKYCKMLTDLEQQLKDLEKALQPMSKDDIQKEIDELQYRLDHLDEKYSLLFNGDKSIEDSKEKLAEMEKQNDTLSNICSWNKNIDEVMKLLNSFMNDLQNQTNPFEKQAEFLNNEVISLTEELKKLSDEINLLKKGNPTTQEDNLKKLIDDLSKQIKDIENEVCTNQSTISFNEVNDKLSDIQNLKKLRSDAEQALNTLKTNRDTNIEELEQEKKDLEDRLEETKKLAEESNNQSANFNKNLNIDLSQFPNVLKWFPVAVNILCNSPKMIVNILVALLNEVGRMTNLPDLWKFQTVE